MRLSVSDIATHPTRYMGHQVKLTGHFAEFNMNGAHTRWFTDEVNVRPGRLMQKPSLKCPARAITILGDLPRSVVDSLEAVNGGYTVPRDGVAQAFPIGVQGVLTLTGTVERIEHRGTRPSVALRLGPLNVAAD